MRKFITVMILENLIDVADTIADKFLELNEKTNFAYTFEVEITHNSENFIEKIRKKDYKVIIMDVFLEEDTTGIELNLQLALAQQHGYGNSIRIIYSGRAKYKDAVKAMRCGAWDYINKGETGEYFPDIVIKSTIARLKQMDIMEEQIKTLSEKWIPKKLIKLKRKFSGKLVAIYHNPEPHVIGYGIDAFELEKNIYKWRKEHEIWEEPMVVSVPKIDKY